MRRPDDGLRLRHMLEATRKAIELVEGRQRPDLDTDEMLSLALARPLEILGEAASGASEDFRQANREIPWRDIIATRNRLIHAYFAVDHDIVWKVVSEELPSLLQQLEKIDLPRND